MNSNVSAGLERTQALILAGGRGERMHPLTVSRPKPAVSFGEMFRIIDFTLSNCFYSGISRVSLLTQAGHGDLLKYVSQGWSALWQDETGHRKPLRLLPPATGKRYRGTADAVCQNSRMLKTDDTEHVLILSGDHVYHMDYHEVLRQHVETSADLTIAAVECPRQEAIHFGVIEVHDRLRVTAFVEKPYNPRPLPSKPSKALVSMGVYVFRKKVLLESLEKFCKADLGYDFGHDIIPSLIPAGRTFAFNFRDDVEGIPRYWRDIGTLDGYYETCMDLVRPEPPFDPFANDGWPSQPTRHPVLAVSRTSRQSLHLSRCCDVQRSIISMDVRVGDGAVVTDSVLLPGVRIGKGARLRRVIVDEGVHIPAGFRAGFDLDQDRREHIVTKGGVVVIHRTPMPDGPVAFRSSPSLSSRKVHEPAELVNSI